MFLRQRARSVHSHPRAAAAQLVPFANMPRGNMAIVAGGATCRRYPMAIKSSAACRIGLPMMALVLFLIYASVPIYAGFWHLVHGNSVQCGNRTIPVPNGWFSKKIRGDCLLETSSPSYTLGNRTAMVMLLRAISSGPSVADEKWRQDYLDRMRRVGNLVTGTEELVVAGEPTACFEWKVPSKPLETNISCLVDREMAISFGYDDPKWKNVLYDVLRGIR
jgi:hypothetical protein